MLFLKDAIKYFSILILCLLSIQTSWLENIGRVVENGVDARQLIANVHHDNAKKGPAEISRVPNGPQSPSSTIGIGIFAGQFLSQGDNFLLQFGGRNAPQTTQFFIAKRNKRNIYRQ